MTSITDPMALKPADVYRQACFVNAKTSRGLDRGWYQDPFDLDFQWHLWFEGGREVSSATFSRVEQCWRQGPALSLAGLTTGEGAGDLLAELLDRKHFRQRPNAIGVILHVADEFALSEVIHAKESAGVGDQDLAILHFNLIDDPREVLVDHEVSLAATSWRLLPFWGAGAEQERCAAVALSRSREVFLQKLLDIGEECRVPIRVAVTSAPVEMLAAVPLLKPELPGGLLIAVHYLKFTAVFAITPSGELRSARTLLHRGNAPIPVGFGDILWNMALSTELTQSGRSGATALQVLLLADNQAALLAAQKDLDAYSSTRNPIQLETVELSKQEVLLGIPGYRPEFLVYDQLQMELTRLGASTLAMSKTFPALRKEWIRQCNFFNTAKLDAAYPSFRDLRLLRLSSWLVRLTALVLVGAVAHGTFSLIHAMRHPSWNLTLQEIERTEDAQLAIELERQKINDTNTLLQPRSRGWVALEFILQLFPESAGICLESFSYGLEATPPAAANGRGQAAASAGLARTWVIKGMATTQALELLNRINAPRIVADLFKTVAKATGDASYNPDPFRQISVTQSQGRNSKFETNAAAIDAGRDPSVSFPFNFEATITQSIPEKDALALPTKKPF